MSLKLDKSSWKRVAFGDVIDSVTDRVNDPSAAGVDRYVGLEHLDPGVLTVERWDSPEKVEAQKLRFQPGDVIFGRRRAYQKKVARANFEGICSAHALVLRAKPEVIEPDFLPVFLASDYFLDRAVAISVGSLSPTVNWRDLKVEEFDLPPLEEQKRIAALLWAIEEHRQQLANSVNQSRIASESWLERRLESEATARLDQVATLQHGRPVPSQLYGKEGVPLLRPGDMKPDGTTQWTDSSVSVPTEFVQQHREWLLSRGDVVINMTAQSLEDRFLGRVCRMHDSALLNQRIGRLRPRADISNDFLHLALSTRNFTDWVARRCEGSKVKHMHWRHIEDFPIAYLNPAAQAEVVAQAARWQLARQSLLGEQQALLAVKSGLSRSFFGDPS